MTSPNAPVTPKDPDYKWWSDEAIDAALSADGAKLDTIRGDRNGS